MTKPWNEPQPASDWLKRFVSGTAPVESWLVRSARNKLRTAADLVEAHRMIADLKRRQIEDASSAFKKEPTDDNLTTLVKARTAQLHVADNTEALKAMPYEEYLKTDHWLVKREEALFAAQRACLVCNDDKHLQVHHRTYERRGYELLSDLAVLCDGCHSLFHRERKLNHE